MQHLGGVNISQATSSGSFQSLTRVSCVVVLGIDGSLPNYHLCCAGSYRDIDSMENEHIMLEGPILHSNISHKVRTTYRNILEQCWMSSLHLGVSVVV